MLFLRSAPRSPLICLQYPRGEPLLHCRCSHALRLTPFAASPPSSAGADFTGGTDIKLRVASLQQMLSLPPAAILTKLRALLGIVLGLFCAMHVFAGAAFALDRRHDNAKRARLLRVELGFRQHAHGAWTWSVAQGRVDGPMGRNAGPFTELSRLIGVPPVRLRSAIPEEMLPGSLCARPLALHQCCAIPGASSPFSGLLNSTFFFDSRTVKAEMRVALINPRSGVDRPDAARVR